jgi:hypothetical protein
MSTPYNKFGEVNTGFGQIATELLTKQDKETGKQLSTEDFAENGIYQHLRARSTSKNDVGLGSADNLTAEQLRAGTTKNHIGLDNVLNLNASNTRKYQTSSIEVGLGNVENITTAQIREGANKSEVGLGNVDNITTAQVREGATPAEIGLGNVENYVCQTPESNQSNFNTRLSYGTGWPNNSDGAPDGSIYLRYGDPKAIYVKISGIYRSANRPGIFSYIKMSGVFKKLINVYVKINNEFKSVYQYFNIINSYTDILDHFGYSHSNYNGWDDVLDDNTLTNQIFNDPTVLLPVVDNLDVALSVCNSTTRLAAFFSSWPAREAMWDSDIFFSQLINSSNLSRQWMLDNVAEYIAVEAHSADNPGGYVYSYSPVLASKGISLQGSVAWTTYMTAFLIKNPYNVYSIKGWTDTYVKLTNMQLGTRLRYNGTHLKRSSEHKYVRMTEN